MASRYDTAVKIPIFFQLHSAGTDLALMMTLWVVVAHLYVSRRRNEIVIDLKTSEKNSYFFLIFTQFSLISLIQR